MNHPTSEDLLDLALDTLEGDRLREVAAHVARCGTCGGAYRELRAEQNVLHRALGRPLPGAKDLEDRVLERLPKNGLSRGVAAVLIGLAALVFLGVLGVILLAPRNDPQVVLDRLELIEREANALDEAGRFEEAVAKYKDALARAEGNDYFKAKAMFYKARIKELEADRLALADANRLFAALQAEFRAAKGADMHHDLLNRAKMLREACRNSDVVTWKRDLQILIERVEKVLDTEAATNKRLDFQVRRNEIMTECKLSGDPNKAEWGRAIRAWRSFLGEEIAENSRTKVGNEIRVINNRARDSFRTVLKRVRRLVDGNQKADAIEMIRKEAHRFEGTESEKDLEDLLKGLDL